MKEKMEAMELMKDMMDQYIDLILNYRQSGHPGGSRSKVPIFLGMIFSGEFRFDIRNPENPYADR
ncbi:MAG TPA: hypothetical protein VJC03_02280, partial [bacterium]|nr:hypothetical protein [bacterium]